MNRKAVHDLELVELIYATVIEPDGWQAVLDAFAMRFPGAKLIINAEDSTARRNIGLIHRGFDAANVKTYVDYYCKMNPWVPFWSKIGVLEPNTANELLPSSTFVNTEFYCDWLRREDEIECAAGVKLIEASGRFAVLNIHYGTSVAHRYDIEVPRLLRSIAPHLRNAIDISQRLGEVALQNATISALIESSQFPTWLLDSGGRVHECNVCAARILHDGEHARLGYAELFKPRHPAVSREIGLRLQHSIAANTSIEVRVVTSGGEDALWSINPVLANIGRAPGPFASPDAWLLVTLTVPAGRIDVDEPRLQRRYGLTKAEARLANRLRSGESLAKIADESHISKETARAQLKSIFIKTDTHRQAELVALLANASMS